MNTDVYLEQNAIKPVRFSAVSHVSQCRKSDFWTAFSSISFAIVLHSDQTAKRSSAIAMAESAKFSVAHRPIRRENAKITMILCKVCYRGPYRNLIDIVALIADCYE